MTHDEKIFEITKQVKMNAASKTPLKIQKASVSHFVPNPYDESDKLPKIDLSKLNDIIEIDPENKTCIAESGVTFEDLVRAVLKQGLIPYTVPELKGITIGGAISGCSVESMSYKLGGFHDSCLEYEVITGNGDAVLCSPSTRPDYFHMIHGSYGTLGYLTKIKFKLMTAKPFVKMTYRTFSTIKDYWKFLKERCVAADYDFIDGIIHDKNIFVVCLGQMVEKAPYVNKYDWLKVFYKSTRVRREDYLRIEDYFFRYDADCHWLTGTVPLLQTKPARFLVGKLVLGSTNLIKWSKRLRPVMKLKKRPEVVVDVFIPSSRFEEFYKWYEKDFDFYPLWIVPYRIKDAYPWLDGEYAKKIGDELVIDCAVYGKPNSKPDIDYSEALQKKTHELNGIKTLISRNHYTKDEFWKVYNKPTYQKIKSEFDPNGLFKDLYEKFK